MKKIAVLATVFMLSCLGLSAQCTFKDYKILSPTLVAVECEQPDVSALRPTATLLDATLPATVLTTAPPTVTVTPHPANTGWFLVDLSAHPLVLPKKYTLTLTFPPSVPPDTTVPVATTVAINTTTTFNKVVSTSQSSHNKYALIANALITSATACGLFVHNALGVDRQFVVTECRVGIPPTASPMTDVQLRSIDDLFDVGAVYVTLKADPNWQVWFTKVTGFKDVFQRAIGVDATATISPVTAPSTKDASSYYINFNVLTATGASPAGALDAKIAPPIGKLILGGYQFAPLITASVGQGKIASQSYTDTIDFGATLSRVYLLNQLKPTPPGAAAVKPRPSPVDGIEVSPGATFETDREFDRRNFLGVVDVVLHPRGCFDTQVRKQEKVYGQYFEGHPDTKTTIAGVPLPFFGYSCDIHLFTEDGSALMDTTVKASKGGAAMTLPSYTIARVGLKFHTLLQAGPASLDVLATARYLTLVENSVLERKDNSLYLFTPSGWKALAVFTAAYKLDHAGHISLSATYTNGFDAPKFNRANAATTGLLLKY